MFFPGRGPCRLIALLICLAVEAQAGGQQTGHPADGLPVPRSRLTQEELDLAIRIATRGTAAAGARSYLRETSAGKTVLSRVEMTVGDKNDPDAVFAIVTAYNYERHETSRRLVDLTRGSVVWERVYNDGSAPLAPVERDRAIRLVLGDDRVRELLGEFLDDVEVEFLLPTFTGAASPFVGKRVAMALFKTEAGYLADLPTISANLTDGTVVVGARDAGAEP